MFFPGAYFSNQTKRVYLTPKLTSDSFSISYLGFGNLSIVSVTELTRRAVVFQAAGRRDQGLGRLDGSGWEELGSVE